MKNTILLIVLLLAIYTSGSAQDKKNTPSFSKDSIKLVDLEPFTYVALEKTGNYSQQNDAFTQLWEESVKQFLSCDRVRFVLYYNSPVTTPEESLKWEVGTKLLEDDDIIDPLKKKKWDYEKVAKVIYEGPMNSGLNDAYAKIMEWIGEKGFQAAGPAYQRNLGRFKPNAEGVLVGKVEIWMPVAVIGQ